MNIRKLRAAADLLFEQYKYEEAYYIYDEIYNRIWSAIGSVQNGLTAFSQSYLSSGYKSTYEFRDRYASQASDSLFKKWFDLDAGETLNELTFTTYGHLQSICYSPVLCAAVSSESVYNEFLILDSLILDQNGDWINNISKITAAKLEDQNLKKLIPNYPDAKIKKMIIESAEKLSSTDWYAVNISFLDYLFNIGDNSSQLYTSVHKIVGSYFRHKTHRKKGGKGNDEKKTTGQYEKFESYEKYERYERFEKYSSYRKEHFDPTTATEYEKAIYYGNLLGLSGKVTKSQVRKKYIDLIAKYHPDKVFDLGEELKVIAEIKTKQLNAAYEWMKKKYGI
jgi:DnaJ domain